MEQSPSEEPKFRQLAQFPHFMETENSLPISQEPITCPIPESDQSSQLPPLFILFLTRVFDIFFHLHLGLPSGYYFKKCKHIFDARYEGKYSSDEAGR